MRRAIVVGIVTALLGVALVQERQGQGATLEINTEPAQALVNITGPQGFMAMLDLSGSETLTGLPPGQYYIVATADGHQVAQEELELAEGAEESVSLQLQPSDGEEQAGQSSESQQDQQSQQQDGQQAQQQDGQQAQQDGGQAQDGQAQDSQAQGQDGQQAQQGQQEQVAGGGQVQAGGQDGEQVYQNQCAQCHGQQGEGGTGPALAGNQNLQNAEMVINQIMQGGGGMPSFANQLSEEQIAAVATHEMTSWGNSFGEVSPDQVSQMGGGQQAQQDQQGQQAQEGQGGQQQAGAPEGQAGQATRVEIEVPAGAEVTVNVQLQVGGGQAGAVAQGPAGQPADQAAGQDQLAGGGQAQPQQQQDQQQDQPQEQQGQAREQDGGQQGQDEVQQGTLQILWVEPAGATVTVTGPDGFSEQRQIVGGMVLEGLAPGDYTVTAALEGFESTSEQVEVQAQETAEVSLTLQRQPGQEQPEPEQTGGEQRDQAGGQQQGQQQEGQAQSGQQGEQVYTQQCAQCHGQEGEGGAGPPLAGNQNMQDAQMVVNQIVQGGGGMPAFGDQLSDEEIAAVATHEMNSWGNSFGEVTPDQVAQRSGGAQQQEGQQQNQEQQQQQGQQAQQSQQQAGAFTRDQARVGMQEYTSHCAVCHGGGLEGRASFPPVAGEEFLANWQGRSVEELFEYISTEMPLDRPGSLGHLTYANLTAYILSQNGFAAGDTELDPDSGRLAQLLIQGSAGGGGGQQEGQPPAPVGEETEGQPEQEEQ